MWWEADRGMSMALRYLHMQYMLTAKRLGMQPHAEGDLAVGAARPMAIPEMRRTRLGSRIASVSESDLAALRCPIGTDI